KGTDFATREELRNEQTIGEEKFHVEGVTVEEHWVQVRPDHREKRWCAVVGVSHDIGKPIWARLDGLTKVAGQEHRQFLAAGRYVGLIWCTDAASEEEVRKRLDSDLTEVRLVSVTAFKKEAQGGQESATFTDLDTPAALPPRPRPVWGP